MTSKTPIADGLMECVPNFSEGKNAAKVAEIRGAIAACGVSVLRTEMDPDHNRSVITFTGKPDAVAEAAFAGIETAVSLINLQEHAGVHPRIGAADVVPFVPIRGVTLEQCAAIAHSVGEKVWSRLGVPVYFYEAAARSPDRAPLEVVRRNEARRFPPDLGGPALHPTAGACIIGARKFLIAFNVNLDTADVSIAAAIARKIRFSNGGLPYVKAIGVFLASRNLAQVSMNLTDFEQTPLHVAYDAVAAEAQALGVGIVGSEIIGLVPRKAIELAAAHYLRVESFSYSLVLENAIELSEGPLE